MKLCVLTTIFLSCFAFYHASTIRPATIATISYKNNCDVYLIVNFLLILHKHGVNEHNLPTSKITPLGLLSSQIQIQKVNGLSFVWNPRAAKVIFITQTTQLNSLYTDILLTFKMNSINWEVLLNELIGVNNIPVSQKTIEIFKYLSQMLATALGVKTPPFALLNLYGLLIIPTSLSGKDCGTTTFSPINELVHITDNKLLATEIARCSLIIDAATYFNSEFQFSNCACLLHTCSGYATSPLIGDIKLAESLQSAISGLLNVYTSEDIRIILIHVLMEHVAYCDIGKPLGYIFQDQNLDDYEYEYDDQSGVLLTNDEETVDDSEKCSKAPEIEETTTVGSVVGETQSTTEKVEVVETTTEEVTRRPRIFVDSTTESEVTTSVTEKEEPTTAKTTTSKTDEETTSTVASTTTDAPTTTTTPAPTTTESTTKKADEEVTTTTVSSDTTTPSES